MIPVAGKTSTSWKPTTRHTCGIRHVTISTSIVRQTGCSHRVACRHCKVSSLRSNEASLQPTFRNSSISRCNALAPDKLQSQAEKFIAEVEQLAETEVPESTPDAVAPVQLQQQLSALRSQVADLQMRIDTLYKHAFDMTEVALDSADEPNMEIVSCSGEDSFAELGRARPEVMRAVIKVKEQSNPASWRSFQSQSNSLKLQRSRLQQEIHELDAALVAAERDVARRERLARDADTAPPPTFTGSEVKVVLITGFESFNVGLYQQVANELARQFPFIRLQVFSDRDISLQREKVERALQKADVFFGSLLFDFDEVEWLRPRIERIPLRLVFESALELMSCTQIGSFQMASTGQSKGPPPLVKKVLSMFGSQREEDRLVGYLSFLKLGPKLLQFIPGKKVADLRNWLTIYGYWNQGGPANVLSMFTYLVDKYFRPVGAPIKPIAETPAVGCLHPDHEGYFASPAEYMKWYEKNGRLRGTGAPVVAVLLYRKHVITDQPYIGQLIQQMEDEGLVPVPVFINGVEAHTIVRDMLTSTDEQRLAAQGRLPPGSTLKRDAVRVDVVVSTIGFPLVGGPAGTMEGGRQAAVAREILEQKNIPYIIAAPLLIQDMASWTRDGIAGLQSVVLYSLPELDGAIDTVPLGGLVGDSIFLVPERVRRLAGRLRKWVMLRRKPPAERKVAVLLYGFPPGVGATGTAALLNVPKSLEGVLKSLKQAGYDVGGMTDNLDGESLISALKAQEDQRVIFRGREGVEKQGAGSAAEYGVHTAAAEVSPAQLRSMLTYPPEWGPTEWGPIPFLPDNDVLVQRMEGQWGPLPSYRGIMTTAAGNYLVPGLQLGKVFVGVQPLLGIEGDPMRLLFQRDLTPHPQYAAYYKWLQEVYKADMVLHFGMHGTVEWLPGAALGNTGLSWSDILLGDLPNVYLYACNNPSESIVAKRRGYGTIVSYNVPPYGRAGLYKQLAVLKDLLSDYRENPAGSDMLREPIIETLNQTGLQADCPFAPAQFGAGGQETAPAVLLTTESAAGVEQSAFEEYCSRLYQYLQVVEGRLFSEGLHVLGSEPSSTQMQKYLTAYFGERLPEQAAAVVAEAGAGGLAEVKAQLERLWSGPAAVSPYEGALQEAVTIRGLLARNTEELQGLLRAMNGEFILPEAGGDLLRDGPGVLPTGRNIHALDPYRMPGPAALERGSAAAAAILADHRQRNGGDLPETVAINLWGLDAIKTKGESVAMVLYMVGARPVREGTGRIARFELIPLSEMGGRPRVDVLCNMSGIFRDSFQNVVELLDDLFQRAAAANEPHERNFIRKHADRLKQQGVANPSARLFSNPAGDYGSMVNERVGRGDWESGEELGETWASRNSYSYGKGAERGTARPEVLQSLLSTCDRVVQEIDSVEYGLTDIQEYYANTGALKKAAENARGGRPVGCSIVEAFGTGEPKPRELEEVLRLEYRTKLLNPRWAEAMADQGSGGAFEISQRMTAMVGWGATAKFQDDWVWDQAAETYVQDEAMAEKLRKSNPQAFANVLKRMLEAAGRGMWQPKPEMLKRLQREYKDMDDVLEGVK